MKLTTGQKRKTNDSISLVDPEFMKWLAKEAPELCESLYGCMHDYDETKFPTIYCPNYPDMDLDGEYTIEVGVIIEEEHFKGYYEPQSGKWWVHYGGDTIGHIETDIEGWYYLP